MASRPTSSSVRKTNVNDGNRSVRSELALSQRDAYDRDEDSMVVVWLTADFDENDADYCQGRQQLESVTKNVVIIKEKKAFEGFIKKKATTDVVIVIMSSDYGKYYMPQLQENSAILGVYIICENRYEQSISMRAFPKIKGMHTNIESVCMAIELLIESYQGDLIPISFLEWDDISENTNLNELDPSFMYTRLFKETILDMQYDSDAVKNFEKYSRELYYGNDKVQEEITDFVRGYSKESSVNWYSKDIFLYLMLNRALRKLEGDIIVMLGFFIQSLHRQIEKLYLAQRPNFGSRKLILYRGQQLQMEATNKLLKSKGGLISFNNFLSTSRHRDTAEKFMVTKGYNPTTIRVLFIIVIDPAVNSIPFADINGLSFFGDEQEVLFSMHAVFRITDIRRMGSNDRCFEVTLASTTDVDEQLVRSENRLREQCGPLTGWERLGHLLITIGQPDKAEDLYRMLINKTTNERLKALYYSQLGYIKDEQANYNEALKHYGKTLSIEQKTLRSNHPALATSYNNIGMVHYNKMEFEQALSFFEIALDIQEKNLPNGRLALATTYNNIGLGLDGLEKYSDALTYHEYALKIKREELDEYHSSLATTYNNMATVYSHLEMYAEALGYYKKALRIYQRVLPADHPLIVTVKQNITEVNERTGNHDESIQGQQTSRQSSSITRSTPRPGTAREGIASSRQQESRRTAAAPSETRTTTNTQQLPKRNAAAPSNPRRVTPERSTIYKN